MIITGQIEIKIDTKIEITLTELMCKCPRSGNPDKDTIYLKVYTQDKKIIEIERSKNLCE